MKKAIFLAVLFLVIGASFSFVIIKDWSQYQGWEAHTGEGSYRFALTAPHIYSKLPYPVDAQPLQYEVYLIFASGNTIYVANTMGNITCKFVANGTIRSTPAYYHGKIYFGAGDVIYSIYANNCSVFWEKDFSDSFAITPMVIDQVNGLLLFGTTTANPNGPAGVDFYAVNTENGTVVWSKPGQYHVSTPAVYNEVVYVGIDHRLLSYDKSGKLIWSKDLNEPVKAISAYEGYILVVTPTRVLQINSNNGAQLQKWDVKDATYPLVFNFGGEKILLYIDSGKLYTYSLITGNQVWSNVYDLKGEAVDPVISDDIYVGAGNTLYIFDKGGNLKSNVTFDSNITYLTPGDGKLFAGTKDGLYLVVSDNRAPYIKLDLNKKWHDIVLPLNLTVKDNYGVKSVVVEIDGKENVTLTVEGGKAIGELNLSDGNHTLFFYTEDIFGNSIKRKFEIEVTYTANSAEVNSKLHSKGIALKVYDSLGNEVSGNFTPRKMRYNYEFKYGNFTVTLYNLIAKGRVEDTYMEENPERILQALKVNGKINSIWIELPWAKEYSYGEVKMDKVYDKVYYCSASCVEIKECNSTVNTLNYKNVIPKNGACYINGDVTYVYVDHFSGVAGVELNETNETASSNESTASNQTSQSSNNVIVSNQTNETNITANTSAIENESATVSEEGNLTIPKNAEEPQGSYLTWVALGLVGSLIAVAVIYLYFVRKK